MDDNVIGQFTVFQKHVKPIHRIFVLVYFVHLCVYVCLHAHKAKSLFKLILLANNYFFFAFFSYLIFSLYSLVFLLRKEFVCFFFIFTLLVNLYGITCVSAVSQEQEEREN